MGRSLMPMPKTQRFSLQAIREMAAIPWVLHEAEKQEVIKLEDNSVPGALAGKARIPIVRRGYIRQKDLDKSTLAAARNAKASSCMAPMCSRPPPTRMSAANALKLNGPKLKRAERSSSA